MFESGAVGFYDFKRPITNSNLIKIALQYVQNFNGLVISFPYEKSLCPNGQMHEGQISTNYGLKGIPTISEEIMLKRDLKILEYTGGKIHFPCISTQESVKLIREAKKNKLKVVSDNAQSPGAHYYKKFSTSIADIGGISLNYHKHIHTGEGGVIFTNSDKIAQKLNLMLSHSPAIFETKWI